MIYNRRTVSVITGPTSYGVTSLEMRDFLALGSGQDVELLDAFIGAAYDAIRQYLHRSIMPETLELRMDGFPGYSDARELALGPGMHTVSYPWVVNGGGSMVDLPFGPVQSITSIKTYGRDNSESIFANTEYRADASRVYLNESATWPTDLRSRDSVAIRYVSGEATPPRAIMLGIKQHVAAMYECREGCEIPAMTKCILAPYRRVDVMGF